MPAPSLAGATVQRKLKRFSGAQKCLAFLTFRFAQNLLGTTTAFSFALLAVGQRKAWGKEKIMPRRTPQR